MHWKVSKEMDIFTFLKQNTTLSIKQIKQLLKFENVYVNQKPVTNVHFLLKKEDNVEIIKQKVEDVLTILYEDHDILIVNKPANLLCIATQKEKENTLFYIASNYVKKNNKSGKVFIVHRLDQQTSGIVIFAKNEKTKQLLQQNWHNTKRYYIAIVHGKMVKKHDILKTKLEEDKNFNVHASKNGKLAITEYTVDKENNHYTLLNIQIHTGRKNQIRYQLQEIGYPIVGDKKYGIKDSYKRLYLHANKIEFIHPITQKYLSVVTPIPIEFTKLI